MKLSHVSEDGSARMVNVGEKAETKRTAIAHAKVCMQPQTLTIMLEGNAPKGEVLGTAKVAGIMAAKRTSDLIPMCHNIFLSNVDIRFEIGADCVEIFATAETFAKTGVEMEAITAASVAAITVYDMLKAVEKSISVTEIYLVEKTGGKSGLYQRS